VGISVFDLFKIGVGPSSSHTMGPMQASAMFVQELLQRGHIDATSRIEVNLYGSLSATGRGHGTDRACLAGLMGYEPNTVAPDLMSSVLDQTQKSGLLRLADQRDIPFNPAQDLCFHDEVLPYHPNGMTLIAWAGDDEVYRNTYYSVGGGFVIDQAGTEDTRSEAPVALPYSFNTASELLALCEQHNMSISALILENEKAWRPEEEVKQKLSEIWAAMDACVERGLVQKGTLPGGLNVVRRAEGLNRSLESTANNLIGSTFHAMDWVNLYALAVNEENAAGGRIVTAPTNGAAGIVPAVLRFYMRFSENPQPVDVRAYLLAAAAVGILCKKNASISGAEVGCQGEVGSACAMAAAGLAEVLGGTPAQVENAAEIGLEHNLGLTCDPIGGLVQIPCIERNAIAAVKAINAAQLALRGDGSHYVSLDDVIKTMRETGRDMMDKYKETSKGGLAVNVIEC
jgi:L-serine dehydratase